MTTYTGTQNVDPGLYYAVRPFKLTSVDQRGPLPGAEDRRYHRVPMILMLAAAPLLGLAFVIFLPFIGFAMVAWLLGGKVAELAARAAAEAVRVVRPAWAPSLAFLSRSKPADRDTHADAEPDPWTEEVEKKLKETDVDAR
jgi:hypothetical protein